MVFPDELIALLAGAQRVAVLTGAGVSAESGVPTFREAQTGLWARYDPQQLATPQAFRRDPQLVLKWYAWRRDLVSQVEPNPAHVALAEMARRVPELTVITQNVDGLHQRAGSKDVLELHGNIVRTKCFDCGRQASEMELLDERGGESLARCDSCGGLLRPDVVWFGEALPTAALARAFRFSRSCDLFFSIGTSALVHPAASLPAEAVSMGIPTVEVNPQSTPLTAAMTYVLQGPAGVILPQLVAKTWPDSLDG
jgi:NAD-dependent protein deacetylase/lipoamidase